MHAEPHLESPASERSNRCPERTVAGSPCGAPPTQRDGKCYAHSSAVAPEQRTAARRRGGANTSRAARLERLAISTPGLHAVRDELLTALADVLAGKLPPNRASAAASLARALAELHRTAELEERIALLEERAVA